MFNIFKKHKKSKEVKTPKIEYCINPDAIKIQNESEKIDSISDLEGEELLKVLEEIGNDLCVIAPWGEDFDKFIENGGTIVFE